jgi:hypothetical protein
LLVAVVADAGSTVIVLLVVAPLETFCGIVDGKKNDDTILTVESENKE